MMVIKFRSNEEHEDLVKKVKKMKRFTDELEEMLEECYEDEGVSYRGSRSYRKDYDDEDMKVDSRYGYRYGYRGGMR